MDQVTPELVDAAQGALAQFTALLKFMLLLWNLWQVAAILGLVAVAHLVRMMVGPRLNAWLRTRRGWPKWRLRFAILIQRNLRLILFTLLSWALVVVMRETTWPSRSQIIAFAASVATAWLAIEFGVRLIASRLLRRIAYWIAWFWVGLHFVGLLEPGAAILDKIAFDAGEYRLSALDIFRAVLLTGLLMVVARMISRVVSSSLAKNSEVTPRVRVLVAKLLQIFFFFVAVFVGLKIIGVDLTGLAVFSGAVGLGLGFGFQKVVSNLVSGVIILLDKSIKPGDVISLRNDAVSVKYTDEIFGWIDSIGARYVSVVTRDGREFLIPNEDLVTGQVVNWSHTNDFVRLDIGFTASYYDDPHEVSKLAAKAAMSVKRVVAQRTPVCWVMGFENGAVNYLLRFWISDPAGGVHNIRGHVYLALWDAFQKNGITMPFAQREVRLLRNPPPTIADPAARQSPEAEE